MLHDQAAFDTIVLQGALIERGMDSIADGLKPEDTMAIRSYLIACANEFKQAEPPAASPPPAAEEDVEQPHRSSRNSRMGTLLAPTQIESDQKNFTDIIVTGVPVSGGQFLKSS